MVNKWCGSSFHTKTFTCLKLLVKIFFKQKLITDSAILNKWKFFSGIVDKWYGLPEDFIISPRMEEGKVSSMGQAFLTT